jgi:hypothetical protein
VAVLFASSTTITTIKSGTITKRHIETFTSAFTLGRALGCFGTVGAAFFAFIAIDFYCSFSAFFAAAARYLASLSKVALAFLSAVSFAFLSLSCLFLRAFAALWIFLYSLASSSAAFSASLFS